MSLASRFFEEEDAKDTLRSRRVKVTLSAEQFQLANKLADARNKKERKFGAMTYGGVRGSRQAHIIGIVPELAVCVLGNGSVDERIFDSHGDEGIDAILPGLGKVGVKTTTYEKEPYLRVEMEHFREDIDAYILCFYNERCPHDVWIVGWSTKDEVKKGQQKRFVSGGPMNYVLHEKDLHGWGEGVSKR
jgi:hypothetical protein